MTDYDPTAYGSAIADEYDALHAGVLDTEGAVTYLTELAGAGPVLELGIGTGRLALPLLERGLSVEGVDTSPDMITQLRTKPGGADVPVAMGDFTDVRLDRRFALVVLAFNTIFALPTQDDQVRCFANAARHLLPDGRFVVEAFVPDLGRFRRGQGVWARQVDGLRLSIEAGHLDPVAQTMRTTEVCFSPDGLRLHPRNHRYAWPAELDLMARLAGLGLAHRWGDWRQTPFTSDSTGHVSVYQVAAVAEGS